MLKILSVAISQIGVTEDAAHTNHGEAVKYQIAAGLPKGGGFPWCQSAIYWCGLQAYGDANPIPRTGGVKECMRKAIAAGYTFIKRDDATPENIIPGAQFILDLGGPRGHTGIVESVDADGRMHTMEGNSNSDGSADGYEFLRQSKRHIHDAKIIGFIIYPYPDSPNDSIV